MPIGFHFDDIERDFFGLEDQLYDSAPIGGFHGDDDDINRYNAGYKDGVKAGRIAVMKEAIEKFRQLSQDHLDNDRGEPEYHRGKAHAYSIAADYLEMMMNEESGGDEK